MIRFILALPVLLFPLLSEASEVQILEAKAECTLRQQCVFRVTLKHNDSGWDHYANVWQVMTDDGKVLVKRVLHHPHTGEQPFTRSSSRVLIAADINQVIIRAGDNISGLNSSAYRLKLR